MLFSFFLHLDLNLCLNIPIKWKDLSIISVHLNSDSFCRPPQISKSVSHSLSTLIPPAPGPYWVLKDWMWESAEGLCSHLSTKKAWCLTQMLHVIHMMYASVDMLDIFTWTRKCAVCRRFGLIQCTMFTQMHGLSERWWDLIIVLQNRQILHLYLSIEVIFNWKWKRYY